MTRCDYCYQERETTEIQVAGLSGFTTKRICADCERRYAGGMPKRMTEKGGEV